MQTILYILERARGWNSGLFLKAETIAHYGEQSRDLMRDPEMFFELRDGSLTLGTTETTT